MSAKKAAVEEYLGTGRRKCSVARVRLRPGGSGQVMVNGKTVEDYCSTEQMLSAAIAPLKTVEKHGSVDVVVKVEGGGITGQAGAIAHGIARALEKWDEELRSPLKKAGHMTRDPRMKERKKAGQPGARKQFQFSKR